MNKKGMILVFLIVVNLVILSAQLETLGTFQADSCIELKQTCSNCTYVNISTVLYPNSTIAISNVEMSQDGTDYNYTFCTTSEIGNYIVNGHGDIDGEKTVFVYNFYINGIGQELTQAQGTLYIVVLISTLLIFGLTIWGAMIFPFKNNRDEEGYLLSINDFKYIKVLLWIFGYLELLFIMSILKNITGGFLAIEGAYAFFNIVYTLMLIGMLPFFPLLIFFTVVIWISDKKLQKALKRGIPV